MNIIRFSMRRPSRPAMQPRSAESVFRRFFRLIERLEAAQEPQGGAAPETKARITRLDNAPHRPG